MKIQLLNCNFAFQAEKFVFRQLSNSKLCMSFVWTLNKPQKNEKKNK